MDENLVVGLIVYVGFPASFILWAVLAYRSAQRHPIIVRLKTRRLPESDRTQCNWFPCGPLRLDSSDGTTITPAHVQLAHSPLGLQLRMQPPLSPVRACIYCIPWEYVECHSTAQFGFFCATFCLSGFDDGHTIEFAFNKHTAVEFARLLKQIAAATQSPPPGTPIPDDGKKTPPNSPSD